MRQRARVISDFPPTPEASRASNDGVVDFDALEIEVPLERVFGLTPVPETQNQWSVEVSESLVNPMGNLHGGVALCMAEIVGNRTLNSSNDPVLYTGSLQLTYSRPVPLGEKITLTAETLHRGRTMGVCRVAATLSNGKLATTALVVAYAR